MFDYSEAIQAIPITFAVKIVRRELYIIVSQSDDLALHSRAQQRLKRDQCLTCTIRSRTGFFFLRSSIGG